MEITIRVENGAVDVRINGAPVPFPAQTAPQTAAYAAPERASGVSLESRIVDAVLSGTTSVNGLSKDLRSSWRTINAAVADMVARGELVRRGRSIHTPGHA